MEYIHTTVETMTNEELQSHLEATKRNIGYWSHEQIQAKREIDRRKLKVYFDANPDQTRIEILTGDDLCLIKNHHSLDWEAGQHVSVSAISWHTGMPEYILTDGTQIGWGYAYYDLKKMREAYLEDEKET